MLVWTYFDTINNNYLTCGICDNIARHCGNVTSLTKCLKKLSLKRERVTRTMMRSGEIIEDTHASLRQSFIVETFQKGRKYQVTGDHRTGNQNNVSRIFTVLNHNDHSGLFLQVCISFTHSLTQEQVKSLKKKT